MLSGALPGIGTITLLTGIHGNHFTGITITGIIITGIMIIMDITVGGTITGIQDGTTFTTQADVRIQTM